MPLVRRRITDVQLLEVEPIERLPYVRMIVDTDHHPALAPPHEVGHPLVLLEWEVDAIARGLPVRRVHVEERVRSVVALGTVEGG